MDAFYKENKWIFSPTLCWHFIPVIYHLAKFDCEYPHDFANNIFNAIKMAKVENSLNWEFEEDEQHARGMVLQTYMEVLHECRL